MCLIRLVRKWFAFCFVQFFLLLFMLLRRLPEIDFVFFLSFYFVFFSSHKLNLKMHTPRLWEWVSVCLWVYNLQFVCKLNKTRFDLFECFAFVFLSLSLFMLCPILAMDFILACWEWVSVMCFVFNWNRHEINIHTLKLNTQLLLFMLH